MFRLSLYATAICLLTGIAATAWPSAAVAECGYDGANINCKPRFAGLLGRPCAPLTNLTDREIDYPFDTWIIDESTPSKSQEMVTKRFKLAPHQTTIHREAGMLKCAPDDCREVIAIGKSCI